jgi:hypothetical protein
VNFAATPEPRVDRRGSPYSEDERYVGQPSSQRGIPQQGQPGGGGFYPSGDKTEYLNGEDDERKPLTADFGRAGYYPPG